MRHTTEMGFLSLIKRKSPARAEATPPTEGKVVPFVTRRTEITVEREWCQAVLPAQENAVPVAPAANVNDADVSPGRISGKSD